VTLPDSAARPERIAVLTPSGADGRLAARMLERIGLEPLICTEMRQVCSSIDGGVGVVVVAEEALTRAARASLAGALDEQPSWSDLPIVVLLAEGELSRAISPGVAHLATRGNVTLLERPVRVATLVTTLRSAMRARARQYDVRDSIEARAAAEEVLRDSEARLRAAVLAAPYPLMLHAEDGMVLQLSQAWSEVSGYSADELTTTGEWTARAYGEGADEANGIIRHDLDTADPTLGVPRALGERQVRTRSGEYRTWNFQSVPLGRLPDSRKLRLVAATDVTDFRRLIASERAARQEAEKANRAKMEFLAVMSHELRTPLNAIGGYTQLLELGIHGPVTDAQRTALARIKKSEAHLLGLIEDVLNFAKIEAGRITFDLAPIGVEALVTGVDALVEPQMREKGITYDRGSAPDLTAVADAEKARQVLLNLLSNAVKFTASGGHINVGFDARAREVDICITDTGIGIPPEKQASVFEPFVQIQRAYTSTHGGTGLGLAISRDLARAMHGELTVRSQVGKGSTFTLTLPRAP
jgi:PAS domain S-box-containing protein